jgi:hypothetical protein
MIGWRYPFMAALCLHGSFVLQGQAAEFWLISSWLEKLLFFGCSPCLGLAG